jgi:tripartite-type tricarboxylate transporter receptor subunit TctC
MKILRLRLVCTLAALLVLPVLPVLAQNSDYPNRPIQLVIPYSAGGGNDITARVMSSVFADYLGQPLIIKLRPGSGGIIGLSEVARSKPDGYTLAWPGPHPIVISAFNKVPLDFLKDLIPVAQMIDWQWWLVVKADSPYNTLAEFISYAKAHPGELVVSNSGNLAIGHLPALELEQLAGVEFTHLPFDGGGPANLSVISGDATAVHAVTAAVATQIPKNYKALAITGKSRHPSHPDVPTYLEQGYPIYTGVSVGLVAPAGTPPEIVARLEEGMKKISEDKTFKKLMSKMGDKAVYLNSADYRNVLEGVEKSSKTIAKSLRESGVLK